MPRNMRNFWIEGSIDGRNSTISGGPQSRDGGFELTIKMRDRGKIIDALHVTGKADSHGRLSLFAQSAQCLFAVGVDTER